MKYLLFAAGGLVLFSACSLIVPGKPIDEQILLMQQQNGMGCAFIAGNGTPPASRIDGAIAGGWGDDMTVEQMNTCLGILKELP